MRTNLTTLVAGFLLALMFNSGPIGTLACLVFLLVLASGLAASNAILASNFWKWPLIGTPICLASKLTALCAGTRACWANAGTAKAAAPRAVAMRVVLKKEDMGSDSRE